MNRSRPPEKLGLLIPRVLDEVGLAPASIAMRIHQIWDETLGPPFVDHCRPDGVRNGVLLARVRDSAWMQRVQLEKPRILESLREELGKSAPHDLRFRVATIENA